MGIEIERRFLVKNEEWENQVILREDFIQAYLIQVWMNGLLE